MPQGFPILSWTVFLPLVGTIVLMFLPKANRALLQKTALAFSLATFFLSLGLLRGFDASNAGMQFIEKRPWIPAVGIEYHLGIDGVSLLLILLTTLLTAISVLSSFSAIHERDKEYYAGMLLLETGMTGVFAALDLVLFYFFWEIVLVPMYLLIGIWGGPNKLYAAIKFFLFTLFGSVLMLVGILALYFLNANPAYGTGVQTFNLMELVSIQLPLDIQKWLFFAFFMGFAIKVPMFPFHTWLPDAHVEAPTAGSVILAGVLLKMGTYGFLRFCLPLFPAASVELAPFMATLAIIGIIYGALVAMSQKDMKKLVAYSSVSHLGFVMLGLFAFNAQALAGSVLQMINHGLSTGGLFLIVGMIYERRHTRLIEDLGGLSHRMPVYATLFAVTMFSSIGLPSLNGFVGEFLILLGVFQANKLWAVLAVSGIVLGAAYMLWLYQRVMLGTIQKEENQKLTDLTAREVVCMAPLVILMFWIGLYPKPYLDLISPCLAKVSERLAAHGGAAPAAVPAPPLTAA